MKKSFLETSSAKGRGKNNYQVFVALLHGPEQIADLPDAGS